MRRWLRAKGDEHCGKCGLAIASGKPMLVLRPTPRFTDHLSAAISAVGRGADWRILRCAACADEPVPEALATP